MRNLSGTGTFSRIGKKMRAQLRTSAELTNGTGGEISNFKQMKKGKAAGPSGVTAEMLQAAGEAGIRWVTEICNAILKEGRQFRRTGNAVWIVSVYKGKGDALECGSYRGIKLLDFR